MSRRSPPSASTPDRGNRDGAPRRTLASEIPIPGGRCTHCHTVDFDAFAQGGLGERLPVVDDTMRDRTATARRDARSMVGLTACLEA
jgi:hypothetical protein